MILIRFRIVTLRGWIFGAEQMYRFFILLNLWESPCRFEESVVTRIVVDVRDLSDNDRPPTLFTIERVIDIRLQTNALAGR